MLIPSYFHYCSTVVEFKFRDGDTSRSFFLVQDCFGYPGFFAFPYAVSIVLLKSVKNFARIVMGIVLNL